MPKKSVEQTYKKVTQKEHVLLRPDTYVGSVKAQESNMWVCAEDAEGNVTMVEKTVKFIPALYKIFDEILVNAADNRQRDPNMKYVDVKWNVEQGWISVENDGQGIPIQVHKTHNIYVPELIFGHLLTSSNYDDDEQKTTGGRNGYGAKLCNIFSKKFTVETVDTSKGLEYKQTWKDNMGRKGEAKIKKTKLKSDKTKITFWPDFQRFGLEGFTSDVCEVIRKRVYDIAGTTPRNLSVRLNGKKLKVKDFKTYVDMFVPKGTVVVHETVSDRWEVACVSQEDGNFKQISHVNNIWTIKGGKHVDYVANQIAMKVVKSIKSKNKGATVKGAQVKNHMFLFVNSIIVNPAFDSQTKETLKTPAKEFGSKCPLSEEFFKKILKKNFKLVESCLAWAQFKQSRMLKAHDGKKVGTLSGIPKLDDANHAGGRHSRECTLILTEGDSAKALAMSGLSVVGRNRYGVFPLKGKLLNVREASHKQLKNNKEIQSIIKILGLKQGVDYTDDKNFGKLRYGHLMIMTDQDQDGSHIKGLVINFIHNYWPSLFQRPGFMMEFITPIVVAKKGKTRKPFYTIPEYREWVEDGPGGKRKGWKIKYYKGLGTSNSKEAKMYFSDLDRHVIDFRYGGEQDNDAIKLAFSKKMIEQRKKWLTDFEQGTFLDQNVQNISYGDFVHKELILFSLADCARSIPHMLDGLKPGQRKILFSCFKKNLVNDLKVAQLQGYVSEHSAYHHGEASLVGTIIKMAQDYVGSNNINLLFPSGQFGTRHQAGKDHASGRYIETRLQPLARMIFHVDDDLVLKYLDDDGKSVEPEFYVPVIPMVLVNGADGIGTGWSCNIPNYNPLDIIGNLRRMLRDEEPLEMHPYYKGWNGVFHWKPAEKKYEVRGTVHVQDLEQKIIRITELPVKKATESYKEKLETMLAPVGKIESIQAHHFDHTVDFEIKFVNDYNLNENCNVDMTFLKYMKLTGSMSLNNFMLFNRQHKVSKYSGPLGILKEFYPIRLEFYEKRKNALMEYFKQELLRLTNQARFIMMVIKREIELRNRPKRELCEELHQKEFDMIFKALKARKAGNNFADEEEEDKEKGKPSTLAEQIMVGYQYLLKMAIQTLTKEKAEELLKKRDEKKEELKILTATPIKQIWRNDLDKIEEEYTKIEEEFKVRAKEEKTAKENSGKKGKKGGKRRRNAKAAPRKRKKKNDDDDDDDFVIRRTKKTVQAKKPPKKKAKTMEAYAVKPPPKPQEKKVDAQLKKLTSKFNFMDDSSDDEEDFSISNIIKKYQPVKKAEKPKPEPKKKKPAPKPKKKPAPKPKKKRKLEEDSDDEFIVSRPPAPTKKRRLLNAPAVESSESDEEKVEFVTSPPSSPPRSRPRRATKKVNYESRPALSHFGFMQDSESSEDEFKEVVKDDRFSESEGEAYCLSDAELEESE